MFLHIFSLVFFYAQVRIWKIAVKEACEAVRGAEEKSVPLLNCTGEKAAPVRSGSA